MTIPKKPIDIAWLVALLFLQPTTIIALFGPAVINANLRFLMGDVALTAEVSPSLRLAMQNEWTVGISEWETQLYTYVMAFIVLASEVMAIGIYLMLRSDSRRIIVSAKRDWWSFGVSGALIFNAFFFASIAFFGGVGTIEAVTLYVPSPENLHELDFMFPPMSSPITWGRGLVMIAGIVLVIWGNSHLPNRK